MSDEITAASLRALFDRHKIVATDDRPPSQAALAELAGHLALLRICFERGSLIARQAQQKAQQLLEELIQLIPDVIQTNTRLAEFSRGQGEPTDSMDRQIQTLTDLMDTVGGTLKAGIGWGVFPDVRDWHDIAVPLSGSFRIAMRSTNPDLELKWSNDGPVAKFLVAVIPLITGENPTRQAVMRHVQREMYAGNTTNKPVTRNKLN